MRLPVNMVRLLLAVSLLVAAGCGGGSPAPKAATPPAAPAPPQAPQAAGAAGSQTPAPAAPAKKPTTLAELIAYTGPDRQQILEEGAKKEGNVVVYYSTAAGDFKKPVDVFRAKYPQIKVQDLRVKDDEQIVRYTAEMKSGAPSADVLENAFGFFEPMRKADGLIKYSSPNWNGFPKELVGQNGGWYTPSHLGVQVLEYSTKLVTPEELPKTYDDLLNPKWKGKIGINQTNISFLASFWKIWGETKARDYFTRLGAQNPHIRTSGGALNESMSTGEFALSINMTHLIERDKNRGMPLDWKPLEPAVALGYGVMLAKTVKNPHAALLFMDHMYSVDAQKAYQAINRVTLHKDVPPQPARQIQMKYVMEDLAEYDRYDQHVANWQKLVIKGAGR